MGPRGPRAALGVGDGNDRAHPELVTPRIPDVSEKETLDARFTPVRVRQVAMSKLHTVIVTDEPRGNLGKSAVISEANGRELKSTT